jgi:uncharacterized protein (DUF58 family)
MIKSFYLNKTGFIALGVCFMLFCFGLVSDTAFLIGKIGVFLLVLLVLIETILLFRVKNPLSVSRKLPVRLSNGDTNLVELNLVNYLSKPLLLTIFEDLPVQLQIRTWQKNGRISAKSSQKFSYEISPKKRGLYQWQNTYVIIQFLPYSLVSRKLDFEADESIECYPSFEQFKKIPIKATVSNFQDNAAENKVRKIGQSLDFEQIKEYTTEDDYRHINWKASAKKGQLMLNQYQEERSQDIYCILDMGRAMKSSFENQSLLDYAINAVLGLSKTVISLQDKAGVLGFTHDKCLFLPARKDLKQFGKINEMLFNLKTDFLESSFELLYKFARINIKQRSLLIIFSNFDSVNSLNRQMIYLKALAKYHVVLVVFYENTVIAKSVDQKATDLKGIYTNTMGLSLLMQNRLIIKELNSAGIQSLMIQPKNLNLEVIRKFVEIKKKRLI